MIKPMLYAIKGGVLSLICGHVLLGSLALADPLVNFAEPNTKHLLQSIKTQQLNVIQLGDSHTAADVMTGAMRQTLQAELGNGGMGWGMPMYFTGQRLALYGYDHVNWQPISSRTTSNENYTLGGLIAEPKADGAVLTIKNKLQQQDAKDVMVNIRQGIGDAPLQVVDAQGKRTQIATLKQNNQWEQVKLNKLQLPFTVTALHSPQTALGGWWITNSTPGAVVSAIGINGAQLKHLSRWNSAWGKALFDDHPDLVVLAYGTNEVYNKQDVSEEKQILISYIQQIRQFVPDSAILIVSAPEILINTQGQCGTRPETLDAFQAMQRDVAQQQHTLFWDWQAAMGGSCKMKAWMKSGLAAKDGIHFSPQGYQQLGEQLANALLSLK
ncbi:SGNH/GDSL hydrolase family protein [Acinetobacter apis]|uniref:Lysophospholipase L1 n=1 Tax=Acinetobacter apis TaxID=1229165 RepID=A0A217EE51_9GAMM|nr:GDSL-type esterase/lipase family protein [Acinetobacter apis]SNQ28664.1 Lysophospholipase L1 [Acinetobacter apis]